MKKYSTSSIEAHPFGLFAGSKPEYLVVGSFPPGPDKFSYEFYYPNAMNRFWKIMTRVFPDSHVKLNLKT